MKYYYREHLLGYERVRAKGKTAWGEIHGVDGFDNFSSRAFLDEILPRLRLSVCSVQRFWSVALPGKAFPAAANPEGNQ